MSLLHDNINRDVADGLEFILEILPNSEYYSRSILVGPYHRPYKVWSKDDILYRYKAMSYEDCYLNAFPNYDAMIEKGDLPPTYRPPPNHLMIDLDRKDFVDDEAVFQQAVADIKTNISKYITGITGKYLIIIDSGNGYHIHVPMPGITKSFEEMPEFEQFKTKPGELDVKFLRYLEHKLTGGKSDKKHNPSVNSLMFRIPGTINTKARDRGKKDPYVKIIEGYQHLTMLTIERSSMPYDLYLWTEASRPTLKLLNDFYLYLMHKKTVSKVDEFDRREKKLWQSLDLESKTKGFDSNTGIIPWIEKILQVGIEDQRKDLLFWALAPYLVTIRRFDYEQAFNILDKWIVRCSRIRRLEPGLSEFHNRIDYCLKHCADKLEEQEPWWPISFATFGEYYPKLYRELFT